MSNGRVYITTAIPYVNGDPHVGHALELVQADVLARHRRLRGRSVRFLTGTDDNALKNVDAAIAAGVPVAEFVTEKAQRFVDLAAALQVSNDDFIRTSTDPRHRPGVERLWRACAAAGDLHRRDYEGLYCTGCEAFVGLDDLVGGCCPEHRRPPERVVESNWFFRLSRYEETLRDLIERDRLRVEPEHRRSEVLAFIGRGLTDVSVSRPRERARGWGIPVPGDPEQVVYVWFDALANYVTALGYGSDEGPAYRRWWAESDERLHVVGKGIVRFHAVSWPAILLSAKEPLPTTIVVHDYLTSAGRKLSKSAGGALDPRAIVERYGADAVRWCFLRDGPRTGDADFGEELVAVRTNELAHGLGNLVNRTIALVARQGHGAEEGAAPPPEAARLRALGRELPSAIDDALEAFDYRTATTALWDVVVEANRFVSSTEPWKLAKSARGGDGGAAARLDVVLTVLLDACSLVAGELRPFLPVAAERIEKALVERDVQRGRTLFPAVEPVTPSEARPSARNRP